VGLVNLGYGGVHKLNYKIFRILVFAFLSLKHPIRPIISVPPIYETLKQSTTIWRFIF